MKANEGTADRAVRLVAGIAALIVAWLWLGLAAGAIAGILVGAVGLVLIITAAVGYCPAYRLVGLSTCKVRGA